MSLGTDGEERLPTGSLFDAIGGQTGKSQRPNGHPMDTTAADYLRHIFLLRIQPPTEPKTAPQNPNCRYRAFGCTASYRA